MFTWQFPIPNSYFQFQNGIFNSKLQTAPDYLFDIFYDGIKEFKDNFIKYMNILNNHVQMLALQMTGSYFCLVHAAVQICKCWQKSRESNGFIKEINY